MSNKIKKLYLDLTYLIKRSIKSKKKTFFYTTLSLMVKSNII